MSARLMTLQEFILSEMKRLEISARELARRAELSSTTLVKLLDERNPRTPDLDTLEKLAKATGQPLLTLVRLVKPDADDLSPEAAVTARRLERIPEAQRQIIEALTLSAAGGDGDKAQN